MPKRRVALALGFLGSRFRGLQYQGPEVATVERALLGALADAGAVAPANAGQLGKIGWFRGSRTDRGVHAACTVTACKLLVPDGDAQAFPDVAAAINAHLPHDVRVFSAVKVRGSFEPRRHAVMREYSYVVPAAWLPQPAQRRRFADALAALEGVHCFRNFTSRVRTAHGAPRPEQQGDFDPRRRAHAHAPMRKSEAQRTERVVLGLRPATDTDGDFVQVRVTGASFVYNQIRKMVGCALAVAMGHFPEELLPVALDARFAVRVPLAPAEGLLLEAPVYGDPVLGAALRPAEAVVPGVGRVPRMAPLMDDAGVADAARFRRDVVLPTVRRDIAAQTDAWGAEMREAAPTVTAARELVRAAEEAGPGEPMPPATVRATQLRSALIHDCGVHPGAQLAYVLAGVPDGQGLEYVLEHGVDRVAQRGAKDVNKMLKGGLRGMGRHA